MVKQFVITILLTCLLAGAHSFDVEGKVRDLRKTAQTIEKMIPTEAIGDDFSPCVASCLLTGNSRSGCLDLCNEKDPLIDDPNTDICMRTCLENQTDYSECLLQCGGDDPMPVDVIPKALDDSIAGEDNAYYEPGEPEPYFADDQEYPDSTGEPEPYFGDDQEYPDSTGEPEPYFADDQEYPDSTGEPEPYFADDQEYPDSTGEPEPDFADDQGFSDSNGEPEPDFTYGVDEPIVEPEPYAVGEEQATAEPGFLPKEDTPVSIDNPDSCIIGCLKSGVEYTECGLRCSGQLLDDFFPEPLDDSSMGEPEPDYCMMDCLDSGANFEECDEKCAPDVAIDNNNANQSVSISKEEVEECISDCLASGFPKDECEDECLGVDLTEPTQDLTECEESCFEEIFVPFADCMEQCNKQKPIQPQFF